MNLKELRNKARKGIEPDKEHNSPLLPQKTFLGMDFGIADSISFFVTKNRDTNRNTAISSMKEYQQLIEVDRKKLGL